MGAGGVIKSSLSAVESAQGAFQQKADAFKTEPIDFDKQTNISVVGNAGAAYGGLTSMLSGIKESLLADSRHIGQMGEGFVAVDMMLAAQVRKGL